MDDAEVYEHFFGVYILYCMNPSYKGRTYIGFTVNPNRRINQHNKGIDYGGAWKTCNKGPWNMVLIVHGFPNKTSALRFEWAWQHPHISRCLKHLPPKKARQKTFDNCLRVLTEMLKTGPWCRLPLTVRWLDYEFYENYSRCVTAPLHMPICCGKVIAAKIKNPQGENENNDPRRIKALSTLCTICQLTVDEQESISCITPDCSLYAHLICLAEKFCTNDMILPIDGICPSCNTNILWGDLVRKKIGCYAELDAASDTTNDDDY